MMPQEHSEKTSKTIEPAYQERAHLLDELNIVLYDGGYNED